MSDYSARRERVNEDPHEMPKSRIQQIQKRYGHLVEVVKQSSVTNVEETFIKTGEFPENKLDTNFHQQQVKKTDLRINLDQVLKMQQNQLKNFTLFNNQGDSLRDTKHEEGPLLTFEKKRRELGNDSEEESQNKSTSRFGKLKDAKNKNKKVVKTFREVRKTKKRSRKFISASETVVKKPVMSQNPSPFVKNKN